MRWRWCSRRLSLLGFVLQVLPGFDQVNGPMIALALPIHLGIAAGLASRVRRRWSLTTSTLPAPDPFQAGCGLLEPGNAVSALW